MSRASEDKLDGLHLIVTDTIVDEIAGYTCRNEPVPPALLAQAIKFLQINGIDSPVRAQKVRDALAGRMPEFDPEETNVVPMRGASCP